MRSVSCICKGERLSQLQHGGGSAPSHLSHHSFLTHARARSSRTLGTPRSTLRTAQLNHTLASCPQAGNEAAIHERLRPRGADELVGVLATAPRHNR